MVRLSGPLSALTLPSQKQPLHWVYNAVGGDEGTRAENPGSVILSIVVNSLLAISRGSSYKMLCCLRGWSRDRLGGSVSALVAVGLRRLRLNTLTEARILTELQYSPIN